MLKMICKGGIEIITAVMVVFICCFHSGSEWSRVIHADGRGYYGYLPAFFIYHDASFNFLDSHNIKNYDHGGYLDFTVDYEGRTIDKYFSGEAILQLPFFLTAHAIAKISGLPADGYSLIYQLFFVVGGIFYFYLGIKALNRLLLYFNSNEWVALFIIFLIAFGTNLFYFVAWDISYSHLYSFFAVNVFLLSMYRVFKFQERKYLWIAALSLGFITVLRPVNIVIIICLPFLAGSYMKFRRGLQYVFKMERKLLIAVLLFCLPVFIQMRIWHWETGHFIVYSYVGERFYFNRPMIGSILFGFSKGWFVWTPLAFIGILGYFYYFKKSRFVFWAFTGFFSSLVYLLSCWWTTDYGWCFGAREFIEFLAFPAIGLTVLYGNQAQVYLKYMLSVVCVLCLGLNQLQAYQFKHHILLWSGMTPEKYWKVFGKTGKQYEGLLDKELGNYQPPGNVSIPNSAISEKYINGFEEPAIWDSHELRDSFVSHSGKWTNYIDRKNEFSATFTKKLNESVLTEDSMIQASAWVNGVSPLNAQLVVTFIKRGEKIAWRYVDIRLYGRNDNLWTKYIIHCNFPPEADEVRVFVWDAFAQEPLYIDDFEVDIIKRKNGNKSLR